MATLIKPGETREDLCSEPEHEAEASEPLPAEHHPPAARGGAWRAANTYLLTGASFVIVIAGMRASSDILVPFLLAVFIAVISAPLHHTMRRRGLPSALSILVLMLILLGAVFVLINVVQRAITGFTSDLPAYQEAFFRQTDQLWLWLDAHGVDVPDIRDHFNPQVLINNVGAIASTLRDLLTTTFIVVIVAIFILLEGSVLPEKVRRLPGLSADTWARLRQIVGDVRRYMFLKTIMSLLTGTLVALWLLLLQVDFPIVLGVLAFALNYIPTIGSIVAAVPGVLLAFIEFGLGSAAITSLGYVAINVGVSNGLEPRYLGDGLGLSPLVVILSVLFWGWVLGPMGMLLSVPLTMSVKIALESDEGSQWLAILMSGRPRHRVRLRSGHARAKAASAG